MPEEASVSTDTPTSPFQASTASRTIYVDAESGKDTNSASIDAPLRSLKAAVSLVPEAIRGGHVFNIRLAATDWGDEPITLGNRLVLGRLQLTGDKKNPLDHRLRSVLISSVQGRVDLYGFTTTRMDGKGASVEAARTSPDVWVENVVCLGDPSQYGDERVVGFLSDYGSRMHVRKSHVEHKRHAMRANNGGQLFSLDSTSDGCMYGLSGRFGGIVQGYGPRRPMGNREDRHLSTDSGSIAVFDQGLVHHRTL